MMFSMSYSCPLARTTSGTWRTGLDDGGFCANDAPRMVHSRTNTHYILVFMGYMKLPAFTAGPESRVPAIWIL